MKEQKQNQFGKNNNIAKKSQDDSWAEKKKAIRSNWGDLNENDLEATQGDPERVVSLIKARYKISQDEAQRRYDQFENSQATLKSNRAADANQDFNNVTTRNFGNTDQRNENRFKNTENEANLAKLRSKSDEQNRGMKRENSDQERRNEQEQRKKQA